MTVLQSIRDRAQGVMAWVMLVAIGIPFALWGINNYLGTGQEQPAAVVEGHEIFDRDVSRAYEQSLASLVGVADYDEKQMRHDALERLIREELTYQQAADRSLVISDDEVRDFVQTLPYFQTDGRFDKDKYRAMLAGQNMDTNQFVAQIRRALLMEQFQRGLTESAFMTPDQVRQVLRLKDQEREIEYATLPVRPSGRPIEDAEINAYYQAHPGEFTIPEKVSVEYVTLDLNELAKAVPATEEDLHAFYDAHKASFGTEEKRRVSHILISPEGQGAAPEQAALERIQALRSRIIKGEDFAKVAAEASADAASAKQGGDLGFLNKDGMDENFVKAAAALKQNEVSEPVKTAYGYHLIKLTELIPADVKPFEAVREELRKSYQHDAAETKFYELGQSLTEQAYEHPDSLEPAAKLLGLAISQSGLFTRDGGEGVGAEAKVRTAAFSEDVLNGRNSDPIELGNEKAVVLRVKDHQQASAMPLAEVRETIVKKLREQQSRRETQEQADKVLQQVRAGKPLKEVLAGFGVTVNQVPPFRRGFDKLPAELVADVFQSPRPEGGAVAVGTVALPNGDQAVYRLISVRDGDADKVDQKERESVRSFLSKTEGQREFGAFMAELRKLAKIELRPDN